MLEKGRSKQGLLFLACPDPGDNVHPKPPCSCRTLAGKGSAEQRRDLSAGLINERRSARAAARKMFCLSNYQKNKRFMTSLWSPHPRVGWSSLDKTLCPRKRCWGSWTSVTGLDQGPWGGFALHLCAPSRPALLPLLSANSSGRARTPHALARDLPRSDGLWQHPAEKFLAWTQGSFFGG